MLMQADTTQRLCRNVLIYGSVSRKTCEARAKLTV